MCFFRFCLKEKGGCGKRINNPRSNRINLCDDCRKKILQATLLKSRQTRLREKVARTNSILNQINQKITLLI